MKKINIAMMSCIVILIIVIAIPITPHYPKKTLKIGMSVYQQNDPFIQQFTQKIAEQLETLEKETGFRIIYETLDAKNSQRTQNKQVSYFIDQEYDLLLMNLVDVTVASKVINQAKNADVPIIFFNREVSQKDLNLWDKIYYVGTNSQKTGELTGKMILEAYHKQPQNIDYNQDGILSYIVVEGEESHADSLYRTNSTVQEVTKEIPMQQMASIQAKWLRSIAYEKAKFVNQEMYQQCELLLCHNDDMALGILDYLKDCHYQGHLPMVVGVNGMAEAKERVRQHQMLGTVSVESEKQVDTIIQIIKQLKINFKDEKIEKIYYIEPQIYISKRNS